MKTIMSCISTGWLVFVMVTFTNQIGNQYPAGTTTLSAAIQAIIVIIFAWILGYFTALFWRKE